MIGERIIRFFSRMQKRRLMIDRQINKNRKLFFLLCISNLIFTIYILYILLIVIIKGVMIMDNLNNEEENQPLFNFVVSNIPYNEDADASGDTNFEKPVYDKYMDACKDIGEGVDLVHPARFLFNAGATPKKWNEKMLNDEHFKVFEYEPDSSKYFLNTDIKGGIAVTYYDRRKNFQPIKTFIPFPELKSIVKKTEPIKEKDSLSFILFNQIRYDLDQLYEDYPELKIPKIVEKNGKQVEEYCIGSEGKDRRIRSNAFDKIPIFQDESSEDCIKVLGVQKNKRVWKYIKKKYVDFNHENLEKWKVLVPSANGSGALGETLSTPLIGSPLIGYTQSFIGVGAFETEREANAAMKYIKTKFARTLLGVLKVTQSNSVETWRMVPIQDFSSHSDIDWSKSISEIDQQLYKKYNLSDKEIDFIETHVKEMV